VSHGGHAVADDVVVRRYWGGLRNLRRLYLPLAHVGLVYDNGDEGRVLIAEKLRGSLRILDPVRWKLVDEAMR
jgi:predicted ABC-type ATPase